MPSCLGPVIPQSMFLLPTLVVVVACLVWGNTWPCMALTLGCVQRTLCSVGDLSRGASALPLDHLFSTPTASPPDYLFRTPILTFKKTQKNKQKNPQSLETQSKLKVKFWKQKSDITTKLAQIF